MFNAVCISPTFILCSYLLSLICMYASQKNFSGGDKFTDVRDQLSLTENGKYRCKMISKIYKSDL